MLKTKSVAKLIQDTLNKQSTEEQFRVVYEYGSYKGTEINAIIKQGKGTITPIMNYTTSTNPFFVEFVVPTRCGEDRIDGIVEIINGMIDELNGKIKPVGNGRCMFAFNPLEIGGLETRATAGQSVLMKLEFNIEYSETSGKADEVVYEMALINSPFFERDGVNTRYFSDKNTQTNWYLTKVDEEGVGFTKTFTPINQGVLTQQIAYINENEVDNNEITNKNCAIIREIKNNQPVNYFYYRIENATINMFNQVLFELRLDTIQTYYFRDDFKIQECLINRAHLDRIDREQVDEYGQYKFSFGSYSPLFEREEVKTVPKRAVRRHRLYPLVTNKDVTDEVNQWFINNISHWVYYYISGDREYYLAQSKDSAIVFDNIKFTNGKYYIGGVINDGANIIDGGMVVFVAPAYKTSKRIKIKTTSNSYLTWDIRSITQFLNFKYQVASQLTISNDGYASVYAIKNSIMPPFYASEEIFRHCSVNAEGDLECGDFGEINGNTGIHKFLDCVDFIKPPVEDSSLCFGRVEYQDVSKDMCFTTNNTGYLVDALKDKDSLMLETALGDNSPIEPKLLNEDYATYRLYMGGSTYDMPISKTSMLPRFIYKEVFSPDITKALLIYDVKNSAYPSDIFIDGIQNKDFTGFMITMDLSMWFAKDKLDEFLANNKNNLQIFNNQQTEQVDTYTANTLHSMASSTMSNGLKGMIQSGMSQLGSGLTLASSQYYDRINYNLTMDNMAQSPQTLSALNSNALLIDSVDEIGVYIEVMEMLLHEKKAVVENLRMFGYTYERIGDIKSFDNGRKYYNYIRASIDAINCDVSNSIKEDIKQKFAVGVRFWDLDNIDFTVSNYERWLDN